MLDLNEIKELVEALHEAEEEVAQAIDEAAQAWVEVKRLRVFVPSPELMQRLAALDEDYAKRVDEAYQTYEAQARRLEEETDAQAQPE